MASSTDKRLAELQVGDAYAYCFDEKKSSNRRVKAVVREVGVNIPGYVTPLGVTVEYEQTTANGTNPLDGEYERVTAEDGRWATARIRKDVHVKWLTREWSEHVKEAKQQRLAKAEGDAKNRAEQALRDEAMKAADELVDLWRSQYQQSVNTRDAWSRYASVGVAKGDRVVVLDHKDEKHEEYDCLGSVQEAIEDSKGRKAARIGIIYGVTEAGNPRVRYLHSGERFERIDRTPSDADIQRELANIEKEVEAALS